MNPRIQPITQMLKGNTALFERAVDGVAETVALDRPAGRANHLAYVACHVLDSRGWTVSFLGGDGTHEFTEQFKKAKDIEELEPPPMAAVGAAYAGLTERLNECLEALTDDELDRPTDSSFPFADKTVIGGLTFLAWHESYHVGQLGMLRSYLGLSSLTGY